MSRNLPPEFAEDGMDQLGSKFDTPVDYVDVQYPPGNLYIVPVPMDLSEKLDRTRVLRSYRYDWKDCTFLRAGLKDDPEFEVDIMVILKQSEASRRELFLMRRLNSLHNIGFAKSGGVAAYFDSTELGGKMYVLMETPDETLADLLQRKEAEILPEARSLLVPMDNKLWPLGDLSLRLKESLPLLFDLLRGVQELEKAGVIHASIEPRNVLLKDGRAMLSSLDCACLRQAVDGPQYACSSLKDSSRKSLIGSSLLQAPETAAEYGAPPGASIHVWQLGLLFARMCFGYDPTVRTAFRQFGTDLHSFDKFVNKRAEIREYLRTSFDIDRDPMMVNLEFFVKRFLHDMLRPNPEDRLTTEQAIREVEKLAGRNYITLPKPRTLSTLPGDWSNFAGSRNLDKIIGGQGFFDQDDDEEDEDDEDKEWKEVDWDFAGTGPLSGGDDAWQ